jgi:hypothetical protein
MPADPAFHVYRKHEAAVIPRGVVRLVLDEGSVEVQPRTWYREAGTHYLEALRRDSGEHLVVPVDSIRDVMACWRTASARTSEGQAPTRPSLVNCGHLLVEALRRTVAHGN